MARRIVRTSYTIDVPTFNYDLMLPIWKTFSNPGDSYKPFLYTDPSHPKPELIDGLDPNVETLLIININITAGTVVGGGTMSVNRSYGANRYWDPQRNVYRYSADINTYEYDKLDPSHDYGWAGPRGLQANFYPDTTTFRFAKGDTAVKLLGGGSIEGAIHHLTSFGGGYPLYYAGVPNNANDWAVKFPCVGTVTVDNINSQPGIENDNINDVVAHEPFPGMNHLNSMAAMLIGVPPSDKWKVQINIKNAGTICGFGGAGGSGSNECVFSAEGRYRVVGRKYLPSLHDGSAGGDAIDCRAGKDPSKSYPDDWIKVNVINTGSGRVLAGGGGGGGGGYDWRHSTTSSLNDTVYPSGAGGGGGGGAGLNLFNFYYYWIDYDGAALDSINQNYRYLGTTNYAPIPQWSLGSAGGEPGRAVETYRLAGQSNSIPAGGEIYEGNYDGSPGSMGKDPITNIISHSAGGLGGAKSAGGPGGHQTYSGSGYVQNVGHTTWYPGGNKGGDGGAGGDFASSGSNGQEPIGPRTPSPVESYGNDRRFYASPGIGGQSGRVVIYSDNVTVNIRSARPRNIKGAKTKIDPV